MWWSRRPASASPSTATSSTRSISIACRKRGIDQDRIDRLVSAIQRQLETRGDEVAASAIGEAVMDALKAIDHVAYIRFASVYKDFSEPGDFAEIAGAVEDGSAD